MCCVEIATTGASLEYSNALVMLNWKIPKEAYEPNLVIDLVNYELLRFANAFGDCVTFNSGLDDIAAARSLFHLLYLFRQ